MFQRLIAWVTGTDDGEDEQPRAMLDLPQHLRWKDQRGEVLELSKEDTLPSEQRPILPIAEQTASGEALRSLQFSATGALRGDAARTKIAEAFNAAQPVADRYALSGRYDELDDLVRAVVDGNHHAIIYGARGVGKTSLARVFGDLVDEAGGDVFYHSASGDATFEEVMTPYLHFVAELSNSLGDGAEKPLGPRFVARDVAEALSRAARGRIILILDEFDRIEDRRTRSELASMLKLISDFRVSVQMILVGISTDIVTLIEEHPSLRRHMAAVRVGPIRRSGASGLLEEGARRAGVTFEPDCHDAIVDISLGSPYHVRLLALNAALVAQRKGGTVIAQEDLIAGMDAAWRDWAMLSPVSARLFVQVAAREEFRLQLIVVALVAAQEYGFSEARLARAFVDVLQLPPADAGARASEMVALLAGALDETEGQKVFSDALAPQFLLLAMLRIDRLGSAFNLSQWAEAIATANGKVQF